MARVRLLRRLRRLAAPALAVAMLSAPAAVAQPLPNPDPVPIPVAPEGQSAAGEQQVRAPEVGLPSSGAQVAAPQQGVSGGVSSQESRTTSSYEDPVNMVPNINGDPCTGAWESTACYAMDFDSAPGVVPRSTISSSP